METFFWLLIFLLFQEGGKRQRIVYFLRDKIDDKLQYDSLREDES